MSVQRYNRQRSSAYGIAKAAGAYMRYDPTLKHMRSAYNYATQPRPNTAPAQPLRGKPTRKRKKYKRRTKQGKKMNKIKNAIHTLRQESDASLGTMTARYQGGQQILCAQNRQGVANSNPVTVSTLESVLGNLKWFDPSNPGTLITGSGVAGTYQRNILFKSITQSLLVRNNYQSDCNIRIYWCSCKDDTDQSPEVTWASGGPDGSNLSGTDELLQYPTDYNLFNDLWSSKVVLNTTLSPGQSATVSNTEKDIEYDPSTVDTHNLDFQKEYKSGSFLVVIRGTASHSSTGSSVGFSQAGVDIILKNRFVVKYNAGTNISFLYASNNTAAMTSPVQSHQPTADNIAYSQS
ncbi:MAG: putative capsid protein [Cressdnaviricota sp.]|nr:MAG: putative capsid protein [Cressdnaviricota sp.]